MKPSSQVTGERIGVRDHACRAEQVSPGLAREADIIDEANA